MIQVKFVSIPVRDQDKALAFYTEKLGLELKQDVPFGGGQRWIELKVPDQDMGVVLFTPPGHEGRIGSFINVAFTSPDVMKTYEELVARGVEFVEPVQKSDWGGTQGIFKDPDGNLFVLASYP